MSRHVLITGGSRGIGAAAARQFAREGWRVSINYCRSREQALALAEELRALGGGAAALEGDVSCPEQAAALVTQAEAALGPLDALVCSAGIALPQQLLTDTTDSQWRRVMGVDLDGAFYCCRRALPPMIRRKRGSIVNVSSMWGQVGASCEAAYSAAKAGVIGLTKALAQEEGPSGIRVNCLAPGVIDTPMNGDLSPEDVAALREETPLGRTGTPREAGEAIAYLLEAEFLTGQVLGLNGGMVV